MEGKQLLASLFDGLPAPVRVSGDHFCWVQWRPHYESICFKESDNTWEYSASFRYHNDQIRIRAQATASAEQNARVREAVLSDMKRSCVAQTFPNAQVDVDVIGKI